MPDTVFLSRGNSPVSSCSDASDLVNLKSDEGWEDVEPDQVSEQIVSLLDDQIFPDVSSMLLHCKEKYNFDFIQVRDGFSLGFYGSIKLVNYIRSEIKAGRQITSDFPKEVLDGDRYLKPVLEDDALLFSLDDLPGAVTIARDDASSASRSEELDRVAELEQELRKTQTQFSNYKVAVQQILDRQWNDEPGGAVSGEPEEAKTDKDFHYFNSYAYNDIHETMLKDTVRTDAYRDFIYDHKHLFAGKIVLDVGCGTGILSMFCAKAGASLVIAVDNSDIIDKARENVYNNNFSDRITCLRGKIEEVILPVKKVDIIVSEWMGYCLLYEAMLESVIWARDIYLKSDGLMVPSHINMWIAPFSDLDYIADHTAFWSDVYGFDMKAMQTGIYEEAQILNIPSSSLCAEPFPFLQLSLHSVTVGSLVFKKEWRGTVSKDIDALDGFVIWFDVFFMPSRNNNVPENAKAEQWTKHGRGGVAFTTGPHGEETHWKQGILLVDHKIRDFGHKKGENLGGHVEYAVAKDNSRALNLSIFWAFGPEMSSPPASRKWTMN